MNQSTCPKELLPLLVTDQLEPVETKRVLAHLDCCEACQEALNSLSADETWWKRAQRGLAHAETDSDGRLFSSEPFRSSIDTCFFMEGTESHQPQSDQDVLNLLDPPSHPEMLGQLDEFEIEERIGQGGMGVVFRGMDRSLNRPVAIKIMAPHLGSNDVARQRFEREAKAAAAVVHPNVVPIYRVSTENKKRPYIAMALADGLSLQEHVNKHGPMDVKDIVRIGIQISGGLAEAHKQGLIHRDIKPANVLFEKDVSRILITDFGLARAADDVMMTQSGCLAGTPSYMSPEQVTGKRLDARSDLFSLGSLLYFLATGREPFRADGTFAVINKVAQETPKSPRSINIDIPEVLNRVIERLLEKDPENRIESAEKLESILTQILAFLQEPQQHEAPLVKATISEQRSRNHRLIGVAVGIGLVLVFCLLIANQLWGPAEQPPNLQTNHHTQEPDHTESSSQPQNEQSPVPAGNPKPKFAEQEQENDQEDDQVEDVAPMDPRLSLMIEETLEGLKSNCRHQTNLRLTEIQSFLELPDSAVRKARILIKGVVEKSVRNSRERVAQGLKRYYDDHRVSEASTFSVNGVVFWFEPNDHQDAPPLEADVEVLTNLIANTVVIRQRGGRTVIGLSGKSNRLERMEFWGLALKNLDPNDVARYIQYERQRTQQSTLQGVMILIDHKLNLTADQHEKFEALIQDKLFAARGSLNTIYDQLINNNKILNLEPDFLTETQLAKWRLMKSSEQNFIWNQE